jgi:cytochrome c-type biogenesis protein CcmH/NrfG
VANTFDSYAEALVKMGDKGNAILNYKKALSLDPENTLIKNAISEMETKKK